MTAKMLARNAFNCCVCGESGGVRAGLRAANVFAKNAYGF